MMKSLVPSPGTVVSSSGLPAASVRPGILQLGRVGDEHVLAGGQAGQERQVDLAGVGEDEVAGRVEHGARARRRSRVAMNCDSFCVVLGDVDQRVIADVRGGRRVERGEEDRRRSGEDRRSLADRIDDVERQASSGSGRR